MSLLRPRKTRARAFAHIFDQHGLSLIQRHLEGGQHPRVTERADFVVPQ